MCPSDLRSLAGAFSPAVFKALAKAQIGSAAGRVARLLGPDVQASTVLADAFEVAHARLLSTYPNEYAFKNEIISKIIVGKHSPSTASALIEQPMGSSVADVLILNGTSTVYEVKTDLDSFARLPAQLADYSRHAEYVYVVVSERRVEPADRAVPGNVGVIALRRRGSLSVLRPAVSNLANIAHSDLFRLLRTGEAKSLIFRLTGHASRVASGRARAEMYEIFTTLPLEQAHAATVAELRGRGLSARTLITNSVFPPSLRALAYGSELSAIGTARLQQRLLLPVGAVLSAI
ncbi:sce7726 family protein [Microbacterium sp. BH-3-3-3]|uniref:sce7726 family protein n=1 Tax=Microbacterium sp. BH-3-3-3 TaxID=1906742 RepID=UPI0015E19481|nr:sce7726 family protein [Microbacterium sp. BH-3-3-3]